MAILFSPNSLSSPNASPLPPPLWENSTLSLSSPGAQRVCPTRQTPIMLAETGGMVSPRPTPKHTYMHTCMPTHTQSNHHHHRRGPAWEGPSEQIRWADLVSRHVSRLADGSWPAESPRLQADHELERSEWPGGSLETKLWVELDFGPESEWRGAYDTASLQDQSHKSLSQATHPQAV